MSSDFNQIVNLSDHSLSSNTRRRFDVFLSFRGEDTRDAYAYNLYKAFIEKGIHTFRDDDEIELGKQVYSELMEAIEESKYSVLVISESYASSSWCLNELLKILECKGKFGQIIFAVFYRVDPSDVRKQTGKFGEGFSEAVSKNPKNAQKWKEALEEIAGLKGWVYPSPGYGTEADFNKALTENIFTKLIDTDPYHLKGLVGMTSQMKKVTNLLDLGPDEARIVGLWGMGGLGKTTIARAVYDSISYKFEGYSFIESVSEFASKSGLTAVQEQIISDTLKVKDIKVASVKSGIDIIRKRVCHKRVLIVLDDVDESIELERLIGDRHWYGPGSKIVITTRDRHILTMLHAKDVYEVQALNKKESEELFKSKAFAENGETKKYRSLISRALQFAGGIPLALKVLGSLLLNKTSSEWEGELTRLKQTPGDKVQKVLRISYEGLAREDKEIFLDISCFFRGKYKDELISVLDSCGFTPGIGIENLVRKSLLTILENNRVWMHDLLQKMGWTIVQEEYANELGKRSRLWHHDDIKRVLTENTGTGKIQGIFDNYSPIDAGYLNLSPDAFAKMTNLRVLRISSTCSSIDLPNMLRYLHWHGYPLKHMPSKFRPTNLVELHLTSSSIDQLWQGYMDLPKLKVLDLRHSMHIIKSPEFKGFPNLEILFLEGCTRLQNLHPSIKNLKKLTILILKGCKSLRTIPYEIRSQCFKILIFSGCLKLNKILERFTDLKQLSELYLDGTSITDLPQSIGNSTELCYLNLSHCEKLKRIPSSIGRLKKLKTLVLLSCPSLNKLPEEVGFIEGLEILDLTNSSVRKIPSSVARLKNLRFLSLHGCNGYPFPMLMYSLCYSFFPTWTSKFTTLILPPLSGLDVLTSLNLSFCRLEFVPESISCCMFLKTLLLARNNFESLPASIIDLSNLERLSLRKCKNLKELPELPPTVKYLMTSGCESLKTICDPYILEDARLLCFSNCSKLIDNDEIKTLMGYQFLLNQIKVAPLLDSVSYSCDFIGDESAGMTIKINDHAEFRVYTCPGSCIPKWFTYQNIGASIKIHLPPSNLCTSNLLGVSLSAVVSSKGDDCNIGVQISVQDKVLKGCRAFFFFKNFIDVFIVYLPIQGIMVDDAFYQGGIDIKVCFVTTEYNTKEWTPMTDDISGPAPEVKSCGARLIYEDDLNYILETDHETPTVTSRKFKICFPLLVLFIFYFLIRITMHFVAVYCVSRIRHDV